MEKHLDVPTHAHNVPEPLIDDVEDDELDADTRTERYEDDLWRFWGPTTPPDQCTTSLTELAKRELWAKDDPLAPPNLTRYHPAHDDTLLVRCLLTGKNSRKKQVYVLISAWRYRQLNQFSFNLSNDKGGGRYPRRHPTAAEKKCGKSTTVYLYREIMQWMLVETDSLRAHMLVAFKLRPTGCKWRDVKALLTAGVVHHRNHDPEDCRDDNLELVSAQDNRLQAQDAPEAGGFIGVHRVSVVGPDGKNCWAYRTEVRRRLNNGRSQTRRLDGTFKTAELALLARALWLIAHPSYLPTRYTPTAAEAPVWQSAKELAHGATACKHFGKLAELPRAIQKYALYATMQVRKGRHTNVQTRC